MGWNSRHRTGIGRRGVELSTALVVLVVFGVVFIVLIMLYKQFLTLGKTEFTTKECQSSLLMTKAVSSAVKNFCFVGTPDVVPLQCSRSFISVSQTKAVKDGNTVTSQYDATCPADGNFGTTGCLQQNVVANAMAQCWATFFQGEMVVLQQVDASFSFVRSTDYAHACFICSEIVLKDQDVQDFVSYLQKQEYTPGQTFYNFIAQNPKAFCDPDFVNKEGAANCWEGIARGVDTHFFGFLHKNRPDIYPLKLSKDTKYAVTFIRRGTGSCQGDDKTGYLTNTVQLIPADKLNQECTVVVT